MARSSTGKRLRFEVFKRDGFTCQYCGGQPPDVVLVIDHVTPVAAGGQSTDENLITACEPCNQGKSDRPLTTRIVRPDADLLYLETQQEIAELKRFQESVAQREAEIAKVVLLIQNEWERLTTRLDWVPADELLRQMLRRYSADIVYATMVDLAPKLDDGYVKPYKWDRYAWAVARTMTAEREGHSDLDEVDPDAFRPRVS